MPAWQAVLDQGSAAYRVHVPDGVHPTATGLSIYMTPVLLQALGIGVPAGITPEVRLRMDNRRLAEPADANGQGRNSSITAWIAEPAAAPLTIRLATTGGSATSGLDYQPLPATLVIPAGQKSASIELVTLHDEAAEPEETVQVKLLPDASYVLASPIEALVIIEASDNPPPPSTSLLLIQENFGGTGSAGLNGTGADTFNPALVTAGGNATWRAGTSFRNNGAVNSDTAQASACLDVGSFINNHKGHVDGKFVLSATLSQTTNTWISLGFSQLNAPVTTQNFTHSTASGAATIIYRAQDASPAGEFDMFPTLNQNPIDGPDGNTGARTLGVALDLTPSGGYNGTTNFGTVTWTDSALGTVGSHTFTAAVNFGSILLSEANTSTGVVSNLTLTQFFAPPQTTYASWLAGHSPASGFEADSDQDGISNALEHVFGTDPNTRDMGIRGITKNATSLGFSHPLNPDIATDVSYGYQWSTGLAGWLPSGGTNGSGVKVEINPSSPDDDGIVTVVAMVTAGSTRGLFVRIHATLVQ